jgi:1,2-phenylacetyl-CoA epoxidase catalytic subunit
MNNSINTQIINELFMPHDQLVADGNALAQELALGNALNNAMSDAALLEEFANAKAYHEEEVAHGATVTTNENIRQEYVDDVKDETGTFNGDPVESSPVQSEVRLNFLSKNRYLKQYLI